MEKVDSVKCKKKSIIALSIPTGGLLVIESVHLLIIFKSKRTKQAISMLFHFSIPFTSSIDGICKFLLPYICCLYQIIQSLKEPNNDNS